MRARDWIALPTLLAFVSMTFWTAGARAQTPPPNPPPPPNAAAPAPPPSSDDATMAQAKQHFEAGRAAYNNADYAGAIREFKAAEQLRPSPILDYNIGLSNEKLGKKRVAVRYYRRYLSLQPNAKNKDEVDQRINALESQIAQEPPPATTAQPGGTAPQQNPTAEQPGDMPPPDNGQVQQPPPNGGYDPYGAQPPVTTPPPPKKKKSLWWIGLIIGGAVTITVLIIVLSVVYGSATTFQSATTHTPLMAPNAAERIDRHDIGTPILRF